MINPSGPTETKLCPVCNSIGSVGQSHCQCGFDYQQGELCKELSRSNYKKLLKKKWRQAVVFSVQVHRFLSKLPARSQAASDQWSQNKTAKFLKMNKRTISENLKLFETFKLCPELEHSSNRTQALQQLRNIHEIEPQLSVLTNKFQYEKQLQRYLVENWEEMVLLSKEWDLVEVEYDTKEVGSIDIVAKNRINRNWLLIELKKDHASDKSVGQLLRYMGWFKKDRSLEKDELRGIIISGLPVDIEFFLSVSVLDNVELIGYYKKKDNKVELLEQDYAESFSTIIRSPELQKALVESNSNQ